MAKSQELLEIFYTAKFKKDYKKIKKQGKKIKDLEVVIARIQARQILEAKYQDHELVGNYVGYRECHINPDWLLIYKVIDEDLILVLTRTGSHSDLF